jgi:hypothetical protein
MIHKSLSIIEHPLTISPHHHESVIADFGELIHRHISATNIDRMTEIMRFIHRHGSNALFHIYDKVLEPLLTPSEEPYANFIQMTAIVYALTCTVTLVSTHQHYVELESMATIRIAAYIVFGLMNAHRALGDGGVAMLTFMMKAWLTFMIIVWIDFITLSIQCSNSRSLHSTQSIDRYITQDVIDDDCSICCEKLRDATSVIQTQCQHQYHLKCINKWLDKQPTCPQCRQHCAYR